MRINLAVYMCRQYIQTQEQHKGAVPQEFLCRHADNERLKVLLGGKQPYGWQLEGPNYAVMSQGPKNQFD